MPAPRERQIGHYGWTPDLPDARDHLFAAPLAEIGPLPASVDLRAKCPAVYDQGQIGSCTANAIGGAFEFLLLKEGQQDFMPSRLFVYYNERVIEHHVSTDSGAQIRDGVKSVATLGVCPESEWKYDDTPPPSDGAPWPPKARAGQKPSQEVLHRRVETRDQKLSARRTWPHPDEGLPRSRVSLRSWFHGLREFREC